MSVSFPSASGGASFDPSTYLTNPAAAIADPVDTVNLGNVGHPAAATAPATSPSTTAAGTGTSNSGTGNFGTSNLGTGNGGLGNSSLNSLFNGTNNTGTTSNTGTANTGLGTAPSTSTSTKSSSTTPSTNSTGSSTPSLQQEYQNFEAYTTEALLTYTFGGATALDQPAAPFGSTQLLNDTTSATLGVLSQAAALQNPTTLSFGGSSASASTSAALANAANNALNNLNFPVLGSTSNAGTNSTGNTVDTTA